MSNFMKIRPVGARVVLCGETDRQTYLTKLIVAFINLQTSHKTDVVPLGKFSSQDTNSAPSKYTAGCPSTPPRHPGGLLTL